MPRNTQADQKDRETVYQELDEYVVTNELEKHFRAFFESYTTPLSDPSIANRVGVWISGFFGSGKSHFLKALSYLLANIEAEDEAGNHRRAAEFFDEHKLHDPMIRDDVTKAVQQPADVILFNIDSKASSNDGGNPILNVFLRVFNEYQGFSGDHPHIAHMERHLAQRGVLERFKEAFQEASGMVWEEERDGFQFYQDDIEQAISQALDLSPEAAHKWFEDSEETFSVSVENFCRWVKEYLDAKSPTQRIVFMVDEVGQFIGSNTRLMLTLQTLTENLGTICGGRAWIVVTSQADMDAVLGEMTAAKANASRISGSSKVLEHDFHLHVVDLQNTGVLRDLALASLVAFASGLLGRPTQSQMVVLGDMSLGGSLKPVESLAECLQVAFDAGGKRVTLPMASAADIPTIPAELFTKFQTSFYAEPVDAVVKALGVE
jgi:hypothetical protein